MIKEFLDKANAAYYAGHPIISDEQFDRLSDYYSYNKLGTATPGGVYHLFKMYSLQKIQHGEALLPLEDPIETPKLDGAAIAVTYLDGQLCRIATRGDGIKGLDITSKIRHLVPKAIVYNQPIQVVGEIVAPKDIPNSRNYASGALGLKDLEQIKTRKIYFIAYEALGLSCPTYVSNLAELRELGFATVMDEGLETRLPTDGKVYRENQYTLFNKAGYTAKHPRAAFALKPKTEAAYTKLLDVQWQLGRTGVVSPVAILEPVFVGDAKVSKATLHNMEYINALGLELGCDVEIIRAGEIIPRVVRRVYKDE